MELTSLILITGLLVVTVSALVIGTLRDS